LFPVLKHILNNILKVGQNGARELKQSDV